MKRIATFNYSFRNQSTDVAELYIDGGIVDAGTQQFEKEWFRDDTSVSFRSMREQLNATSAGTINIYINSPGGIVTEAMAIHDLLKDLQSKGKTINTIGRGIVASAATYILMAGNSSMSANSWFMIHNVSGIAYGDVNEVENQAKTLRKFNNTVRDFYASATGLPAETISSMMNEESWLTGKEAQEKGFVKSVTPEASFTNSIKPEHWLFNNKEVLAAYNSAASQPQQQSETVDMKKLMEALNAGFANLAEKLGIAENSDKHEALTNFQNSIKEAVQADMAGIPTNEKVTEMVNSAVTTAFEKMEKLPDAVVTNLSDAVTKAVSNSLEDRFKKLEETNDKLVKEAANNAGGETVPPANNTAETPWGIGIVATEKPA